MWQTAQQITARVRREALAAGRTDMPAFQHTKALRTRFGEFMAQNYGESWVAQAQEEARAAARAREEEEDPPAEGRLGASSQRREAGDGGRSAVPAVDLRVDDSAGQLPGIGEEGIDPPPSPSPSDSLSIFSVGHETAAALEAERGLLTSPTDFETASVS